MYHLLSSVALILAIVTRTFAADVLPNEEKASNPTVTQVLRAFPQLEEMTPSFNMLHVDPKQVFQKIGEITYELRYAHFLTNDVTDTRKLGDVIIANGLESTKLQLKEIVPNHLSVFALMLPPALGNQGIHITFSVREISPAETSFLDN
ncbi:hypothetical protein [Candidatus Paracaedibacter symbiosus]|uniref:hypothetical protein n=1 Tax=Candidatus Paracaedibacter symbiosus TaxID=244582 RepID=UPI0005096BA2|nr:hypothetical protein [Candidatus Paracaedibacter symbiosus]